MKEVQDLLGYQFKNCDLLTRALTHRSLSGDRSIGEDAAGHNERMEFLGDAVLGLAVSQFLFETFPSATEGDLAIMKGYLVSRKVLASIADGLHLGSFLRMGNGEEISEGRKKQSILAGAMEALIASLYLDGGWHRTCEFLLPYFQGELKKVPPSCLLDPKSKLQALAQLHFQLLPEYGVVSRRGPSHDPYFSVEVRVGQKLLGTGEGRSKKEAEQEAAKAGLSSWVIRERSFEDET